MKQQQEGEEEDSPLPRWLEGDSLAPPCQADMDVICGILDLAKVTKDDVLYDLGCGDGRICLEAAQSRGARVVGVEIEEDLCEAFRQAAAELQLSGRVTAVLGDLREVDLSEATVIVLYLLPEAVAGLKERLVGELRRGCRVVCNTFALQGLAPVERSRIGLVDLYLYDARSLQDR